MKKRAAARRGSGVVLELEAVEVKMLDQVLRSMWRGAHPGPIVDGKRFRSLADRVHALAEEGGSA